MAKPRPQFYARRLVKMAGILELPKTRVTCALLSQFISKPVCFVGRVEKVNPSGKSFTVADGEGKIATVELNDPVSTTPPPEPGHEASSRGCQVYLFDYFMA
ncbi:Replication protein A subunit [Liparis tanakae]|uniref:Replication protein A subunit n=1 Tax=Liparis tanakae TaxID=230148 RepID=A0A4Z2ECC8_9TELE|nr:Replication protein A subunit [Liparis tanakae]